MARKLRLKKAKAYVQEWMEKSYFNAKAVGSKMVHPFNRDERRMVDRARATLSRAAETLRRGKVRAAEEEEAMIQVEEEARDQAGTRVKN